MDQTHCKEHATRLCTPKPIYIYIYPSLSIVFLGFICAVHSGVCLLSLRPLQVRSYLSSALPWCSLFTVPGQWEITRQRSSCGPFWLNIQQICAERSKRCDRRDLCESCESPESPESRSSSMSAMCAADLWEDETSIDTFSAVCANLISYHKTQSELDDWIQVQASDS